MFYISSRNRIHLGLIDIMSGLHLIFQGGLGVEERKCELCTKAENEVSETYI